MLARSIARRVIRLRSARELSRGYYSPVPRPPSVDRIPPSLLRDRYEPSEDPTPLQLYQPELPKAEEEAETFDLDQLRLLLTEQAEENEPELDEEALRDFYRNMVASGSEGVTDSELLQIPGPSRLGKIERREILKRLEGRLAPLDPNFGLEAGPSSSPSSSSSQLLSGTVQSSVAQHQVTSRTRHQSILDILQSLNLPESSGSRNTSTSTSTKGKERERAGAGAISLGLVTNLEWKALFEECMSAADARGAEAVTLEMVRHGVPAEGEWIDEIMRLDSKAGRVKDVIRLQQNMLEQSRDIDDQHQAALVSAIINQSGHNRAILYLKEQEADGTPLPQAAYNVILSYLTVPDAQHRTDSHSRALARDLFAHMRLMAHPFPSRETYRTMIQACASSDEPQPERARDLWIEMTTDGDTPAIDPDREDYDAIIRALCTTKTDIMEGFDLFRQMLGRHQEAIAIPFEEGQEGRSRAVWSKYVPSMKTFEALLQGTKRAGDLERTRWLVLEMVKLVQAATFVGDAQVGGPHTGVVEGIFHAYATWRPLKGGGRIPITSDGNSEVSQGISGKADTSSLEDLHMGLEPSSGVQADAGYIPSPLPQTSGEALREATSIFERILYDVKCAKQGRSNLVENPFASVKLSSRTVLAYLSVVLTHSSYVGQARELWDKAWADANAALKGKALSSDAPSSATQSNGEPSLSFDPTRQRVMVPDGWAYLEILHYCAHGGANKIPAEDRTSASKWAKEVWPIYRTLLDSALPIRKSARVILPDRPSSPSKHLEKPDDDVSAVKVRAQLWQAGFGERQIERAWKCMIRIYALNKDAESAMKLLKEFSQLFPARDILSRYQPSLPTGLSMRMDDPASLAEPDVPAHLVFHDVMDLHQLLVLQGQKKYINTLTGMTRKYQAALERRRMWRMRNRGVNEYLPRTKVHDARQLEGSQALLGEESVPSREWKRFGNRFVKVKVRTNRNAAKREEVWSRGGIEGVKEYIKVTARPRGREIARIAGPSRSFGLNGSRARGMRV